jgi:tetratricopeptide (TPR) repeat protein
VRYSAFISYNHRDRRWAAWLHRELERYRLPNALIGRDGPIGPLERRLPPVFQDREELAASSNLADSVREALAESASLIVICSRNGAGSHWVNEEVREFARLGRRDRIQCLIVPEADGHDGISFSVNEVFPPALLEVGPEPLAADARKSGDGKHSAFLKLVAGIIGVRYDELRQREQARRQRRLLSIAAAASVGFVVMTALSIFAFVSRAEAVHQRDVARQNSITAQRTTDFVKGLFQVSDPSEAKGQTITAREVLDQGARQIVGQLDDEPDVKAELISTLSEVYMGLGSFRRADDLIRQSLSLEVARPETRARQLGVLASSHALQGDYAKAAAAYSQALALVPDPARMQDPPLRSRLLVGKAESLAATDNFDEALKLARSAFDWDRANDGPRAQTVARDLEAIGLAQQFAGDFPASRLSYEQALRIRLAEGRLHPKVAEDLNELGTVAYFQHDSAAAEKYWRQSLPLTEKVLGPDHPDVGSTLNNLARVLVEQRKFAQAVPLLTRSTELYLAQRTDTHDDLAFIFANLALAKNGVGKTDEAEGLFERALRAAEVHKHRLIAPIMVDLADLRCRRGDYASANDLLKRAAPIMKETYPDDAWRSAWVENTRGACLLRQNKRDEARALIASSSPIVLKRWAVDSLYGYPVRQRMRAVGLA